MSLYIYLLAFVLSYGNNNDSETIPAQAGTNEAFEDNDDQQNMLVGEFHKEDLQKEPYSGWFNSGYDSYSPSEEAMATIKEKISEYEIIGFMGTWCPDSRREVPHFFKILDEAGYDLSKLTMVGVDRRKSTPDKLEEGHNVTRVPTFIFMKDGKEVNRYVEYAKDNMEEDIAAIVSGKEYKDSYSN